MTGLVCFVKTIDSLCLNVSVQKADEYGEVNQVKIVPGLFEELFNGWEREKKTLDDLSVSVKFAFKKMLLIRSFFNTSKTIEGGHILNEKQIKS